MTTLIVGLVIGTALGMFVMALLSAADRGNDMDFSRHTCGPRCVPLAGLHRSEW